MVVELWTQAIKVRGNGAQEFGAVVRLCLRWRKRESKTGREAVAVAAVWHDAKGLQWQVRSCVAVWRKVAAHNGGEQTDELLSGDGNRGSSCLKASQLSNEIRPIQLPYRPEPLNL
jgi:hypothetical protein